MRKVLSRLDEEYTLDFPIQFIARGRGWSRNKIKAAVRGFDQFAQDREPSYQYHAQRLLRDNFHFYNLIALSYLKDHAAWDLAVGTKTKQGIDEDALNAFLNRIGAVQEGQEQEWFETFKRLNETTSDIVIGELRGQIQAQIYFFDEGIVDEIDFRARQLAHLVTTSNIEGIREAAVEGMRAGDDKIGIANRIRAIHDEGLFRDGIQILDAEQRSILIARTETTAMTNGSSLRGMQAAERDFTLGYRKLWMTVGDARVRPAHTAEEGPFPEGIPLDEAFEVTGLEYPQEPNCRCTLMYIDSPTTFRELAGLD